ncbi:MAG: hypothetical protein IH596_08755 [Bacteroidales bacterium]|nr:hypothetical protein [Bacteroidales bacterium]
MKLVLFGTFLVFLLFACEIGLRVIGFKPDILSKGPTIRLEPPGNFFIKDSVVGYGNKPGTYKLWFTDDYFCINTNDSAGCRITKPLQDYPLYEGKESIWLYGCSNSYGWSLNDWEAYPYKLQQKNPEINLINFSVTGFGTIQALLQLQRELLVLPKPKMVIVAYAALHDGRNTMTATRRKAATVYNFLGPLVQPYGKIDHDSLIISTPIDVVYNRMPLNEYSALIYFVERAVNNIINKLSSGHNVSKAIILRLNDICIKNNIVFVVAGIASDNDTFEMLDFCRSKGIRAVDISLSNHSGVFSNDPYDGHPNAIANSYYAGKLNQYLHAEHLVP